MQKNNIDIVVPASLGVILLLLLLLAITGMYQIRETNQNMSNLVHVNQMKVELAYSMRESIRLREISINKMLAMDDPFERDEEIIRFYQYAGIYRHARTSLLKLAMDEKERMIQDELTKVILVAQPLNKRAAELITAEAPRSQIFEAVRLATKQQQLLLKQLDLLVKLQNNRARDSVLSGIKKYDRYFYVVILFGVIIIIGAFFIWKVSKYIASKNSELLEKNEQLAIVSNAAQSANKTKSAFLATMSHEIRTPLTAIIGFAETSLDSDQTLPDRINATKTIIGSGKHLLQIINDILDLSKIEANKLELDEAEFSLFELLDDVKAIVKPLADSKGLVFNTEFKFPIPEKIYSDKLRLKQILINLISNAIKFTDTGRVNINIEFDKELKNIMFNVIDSGIGMSEEQMSKIFDAFTQADSSTTRKYGGTGLGLSLSKMLALQLGGDISVKSLENTGSQFKLEINSRNEVDFNFIKDENDIPVSSRIKEHALPVDKYVGRILLAEDNENNQRLISHFIKKLGATISIANNGKVAIDMAFKEEFDLILMDMQMPILGGLDAVRWLRESGYQKPIVALTANAMKKDKENCINAGCDNFLTKPINRDDLYRIVGNYLSKDYSEKTLSSKIISTLLKDEPGLSNVVEKFRIQLPDIFQAIKQLSIAQDWSELSNKVHDLKGIGGSMGFPHLTEISGKIEFQIINENEQEINNLIFELGNTISRIITPEVLGDNVFRKIDFINKK